ncbi:MAG: 50S ribosomal protein L17 [Candidatus Dormibacteria bacterium]
MRHNKSGRKFGRTASHRQAMTRNQVTSLLRSGRIETTEAKAKELRRWVEKVITTAKADDLSARREVIKHVTDPLVTERLFSSLVPRFKERPGGYTRIIHKGPRMGDGAPMVLIELVD